MPDKPTYGQLLARVKELEAREKRFHSLAENTSDLLYRTDTEGNIIYLSKSINDLSGYTMEEAMLKTTAAMFMSTRGRAKGPWSVYCCPR